MRRVWLLGLPLVLSAMTGVAQTTEEGKAQVEI